MSNPQDRVVTKSGYAPVHGLQMYYEMEGQGKPLIYVPPAFEHAGANYFPGLNQIRTVITPDLQGHGRTADIPDRPISLEQHAEDVVELMNHLGIEKADFFGQSFGATIAAIIAVRYPDRVNKVAAYGATFAGPLEAVRPEVLQSNADPSPESRGIQYQKENYKKVAPDPNYWPKLWAKVVGLQWAGFTPEELGSLQVPILIALGDHDFVRFDHAIKVFHAIPKAELAVIPNASHFVLFSEQEKVIPTVVHFLNRPVDRIPFATAETGYQPGKTR